MLPTMEEGVDKLGLWTQGKDPSERKEGRRVKEKKVVPTKHL